MAEKEITPRNKEAQIIYQSALKNAIEYLKLTEKKVSVSELFSLTYIMAEFCEYNVKGSEAFKGMIQKIDDVLSKQ